MRRRAIPDSENRLLILYAMERLGPAADSQLLQFMVDCELMNYFSLQLGLSQMEDQGNIRRVNHPQGPLL